MKIALLTNDLLAQNGWSKYGLDLGKSLINEGHEVLFITSKQSDLGLNEIVALKRPEKYLANPFLCIKNGMQVGSILEDFHPEIVHAIVEPYGLIFPWMGNYKKFITVHGTYSWMPALLTGYKKLISEYLTKKMFDEVATIIAVSNFTNKHLLKYIPNSEFAKKIIVVTNGTYVFQNIQEKVPNAINKILSIAMIKPRKGIKEMLRGLAEYKKLTKNNFICEIIGKYDENDPYYKEVLNLIKDLQLEDNVRIKGFVTQDDLDQAYLKADLYLMTPINIGNEFEGFGLVYLESSARGLPSIGSKDTGAEEAILEGKSGFIVGASDPTEIAQAIYKVLDEKKISRVDALMWAEKNNIKNKTKEIIEVYES